MDRVQIAAIALAVAMIVGWFLTLPDAPPPGPRPEPPRAEEAAREGGSEPGGPLAADWAQKAAPAAPAAGEGSAEALPGATPGLERDASRHDLTQQETRVLENDAIRVSVSNAAARLLSVELKEYADRVGPEGGPVQLNTAGNAGAMLAVVHEPVLTGEYDRPHEIVSATGSRIELRSEQDGVFVTRVLTLDPSGYGGRLRVAVENRSERSIRPRVAVAFAGIERPADALDKFQKYSLAVSTEESVEREAISGIGSPGLLQGLTGGGDWRGTEYGAPIEWVGLDSQYFLLAAVPEAPQEVTGALRPLAREAGSASVEYRAVEVPTGTRVERSFRLYMGPKLKDSARAVDPVLAGSVDVGWSMFSPLVDLFARMLRWTFENLTSNYGVAIILLTILLRVVTFPLTQKSMKSMKRFSLIAPEMKALQDQYKDDKDRLQQEMMSLYKRKGMNPLTALGGGCLPMLIQFPFLIALYFALQSSIELRHAPFMLWIDDLSVPEDFLTIAGMVPIRPLPLLMGASMLLQQRLTPSTGDAQQRQMMMWMSVLFIFLFYQFPSGLVLYWLVSNVLGIMQQTLVNRGGGEPEGKASKASESGAVKVRGEA